MVRGGAVHFYVSRCVLGLSAALLLAAPAAASAKPAPDGFADLAAKLLPAVVNISTAQTLKPDKTAKGKPSVPPPHADPEDSPQADQGSPFDDFLKDFFDKQGKTPMPRHAISLGSGFVIDPSGLVVTNTHVIADADSITVTFQDGAEYKAELIGKDTKTDLAVLRIKPSKPVPSLKFGNSDGTRVGDWVLAIGNPFGLGGSVTAGILSARAREINAGPYDDFLQTDAAINRGNSGGPMFNMAGEVIGINTAIYSPTGGSIGIGFAIPSNLAKPIIEQLEKYHHARRGWLGVNIQSVNDEIAETLGLQGKPRGALIAAVQDGGPAKNAGLQPGDIVLSFDGHDVVDMHHLPRIVAETPIDKVAKVVVWRAKKNVTLNVKVGELKETTQVAATPKETPPTPPSTTTKVLGLTVANLTPELRSHFSIGEQIAGVVVTDVAKNSPAAEKGMRPGDVIVEVTQQEVKTPQQITAKVDEAKKQGHKSVLMLVEHGGDLHFVVIKLDKG
ncbi:MAG: DegQ family serine endoprotease [Stellaceae bacterium]